MRRKFDAHFPPFGLI